MNKRLGFTLVELMLVLVIIAIFAAIAIPSYQAQIRRTDAAAAQQEMQKLAEQLERYKSRNFSYYGFNPAYLYAKTEEVSSISFPSEKNKKYIISLADISQASPKTLLIAGNGLGQKWGIQAIPTKIGHDAILMTSTGVRCKNKYLTSGDLTNIKSYKGCKDDAEQW